MMDAVLRVGLPLGSTGLGTLMEERYISRVRMIPPNSNGDNEQFWIVEAKSIQSQLFDSLKSRWKLNLVDNQHSSQADASCNVYFDVEIEVSNPVISFTLDKVLKDVAKKQVDAFEARCRNVPFVS
jgi:ribosome-associated toxin RatA of RatAB toxin-antitoxin module